MIDPIYEDFLCTVARDARLVNAESDLLRLVGEPRRAGAAASVYHALLRDTEHLVRDSTGNVRVSSAPIPFSVGFPDDYLSCLDSGLQFRVARVHPQHPIFHSNVQHGGLLCLGPDFAPGTRLRPLVEQLYGILSFAIIATDHPFDVEAARYLVEHVEQVRALRAPPLWRRPVAGEVRVEALDGVGDRR